MSGFGGRLFLTGGHGGERGAVFNASHLARRTLFVSCARDAEAILQGDGGRAILEAPDASESALIWVASLQAPPHVLAFDDRGRVTRDAVIPFASLPLRIAAGSAVELSADQNSCAISSGSGGITFGDAVVQQVHVGMAAGPGVGRMTFTAKLAAGAIPTSVRYFYSLPQDADAPTNPVQGLRYPVSSGQDGAEVEVKADLDPTQPVGAHRNVLTFTSPTASPSSFLTVAGQPIFLRRIPDKSESVQQWDPAAKELYWSPAGEWGMSLQAPGMGPTGSIDLMCGLSGLEYAYMPDGTVAQFVPFAPAYAPYFPVAPTGPSAATGPALTAQCPGSDQDVTTSWIYFAADVSRHAAAAAGPTGALGYYSQPQKGGLFRTGPSPFLQVLELQTAGFPAPTGATGPFGAPAPSFPMAPYGGVTTEALSDIYKQFELKVLSPTRSNAIYAINWPSGMTGITGPTGPTAPTGPRAVTPQGMLSTFSPDYSSWRQLILARTGGLTLSLLDLGLQLRAVLLTNQLFLVISDPQAFQQVCRIFFPSLVISGWRFALDPKSWRPDTVLILKFAEKSLRDLVADPSLWSAPGSGLNKGSATQGVLQTVIAQAEAHPDQPEFAYFLNTVLKDWNGILFVNVTVPPADLPPQLKGLAAGLDLSQFKAHHFGINLSPVQVNNGSLSTADSSLFALIYYDNPGDLTYLGSAYDFKVLSLRVLFANSEIASFASEIQLLVARLFGELSSLENSQHGDNIVLNGVMQKHGAQESYSFIEQGSNVFAMSSHVLDRVLISKSQFVTLPQPLGSKCVSSQFLLWGTMAFRQLGELDLFSFGPVGPTAPTGPIGATASTGPVVGLRFSNLAVAMTYQPATGPTGPSGHTGPIGPTAAERSFAFAAGNMVFDLPASTARPQSLYSRFPLQATSMAQGGKGAMPPDLGFIVLDTPLQTGALGDPWFGLQMRLSLGSQGSLAAASGFSATLLAAWAPGAQAYNAAAALKLPGSEGGGKSLTIEGPLKLTIGGIQLSSIDQQAYLMRFSNIALSFFGLKFPPGGQTNLLLFGDPDKRGSNTTLGWYAAYAKDKKEEKSNGSSKLAQPRDLLMPPAERKEGEA